MQRTNAYSAIWVVLLALNSVEAGAAESSPTHGCHKEDGFIGGPFVSTSRAAREIYVAIAKDIAPKKLKEYPIVTVMDGGDHWELSQTRHYQKTDPPPGTVIVSAGGGQLYMHIDKCTGAVSNAAFNR